MRKKISFRTLLTMLVCLPLIMTAAILTIANAIEMKDELSAQYLKALDDANKMMFERTKRGAGVENLRFDEVTDTLILNNEDVSTSLNTSFDEYKKDTGIDCTLFVGGIRRATSLRNEKNERNVGTSAVNAVSDAVLGRGEVYQSENTQVAGQAYFVSYLPVKDNAGNILGMYFAGIPRTDYYKALNGAILKSITIAAILVVVLALITYFLIARRLAASLVKIVSLNTELSKGDLTVEDSGKGSSVKEIAELETSASAMKSKLSEIINDVNNKASTVNASADNLKAAAEHTADNSGSVSTAINEIASGATSQAQEIQDGVSALASVEDGIGALNDEITGADESAASMAKASDEMKGNFGKLTSAMERTGTSLAEVSESMKSVDGIVGKVKKTMEVISSIAEQTNLLSLNASIEAARAGESGKGFAVVADEIGKLAKETKESSSSIDTVMSDLAAKTTAAVQTVEELAKIVEEQTQVTTETEETVGSVIDSIVSVRAAFERIKDNSKDIKDKCRIVSDTMSSLSAISEQNAASSEETSAAMEQVNETVRGINDLSEKLDSISNELVKELKFFKLYPQPSEEIPGAIVLGSSDEDRRIHPWNVLKKGEDR